MNVVVFFSGGASSLKAMLQDENYGDLYRVTGAYTDNEHSKGRELCRSNNIDDIFISRRKFYESHGLDPRHPDSRKRFYEVLTREIEKFRPDLICMSGYMHVVSDPLVVEYNNRILNVHPADLAILAGEGFPRLDVSQCTSKKAGELMKHFQLKPKFTGENSVHDAIVAGERETRSTIHIAREKFDEGPIIVQSKAFPVGLDIDKAEDCAASLQNYMKTEGDGPAYVKALELISSGRISVEGDEVFLDDDELPYCGYRLN